MQTETFDTHSPEDTEAFASKLAQTLPFGSVLALYGDLGAGKTVFARGFARGLGITEPISSPTFTILQEYPVRDKYFYHLDLYRIDNSDAAYAFGIDEFLYEKNAMTLLEWPERIADILPPHTIKVTIEPLDQEDNRKITLVFPEARRAFPREAERG